MGKDEGLDRLYSIIANDSAYLEVHPDDTVVKGFSEFKSMAEFLASPDFLAIRHEIKDPQISLPVWGCRLVLLHPRRLHGIRATLPPGLTLGGRECSKNGRGHGEWSNALLTPSKDQAFPHVGLRSDKLGSKSPVVPMVATLVVLVTSGLASSAVAGQSLELSPDFTGTLAGRVVDSVSGEPIVNAMVRLENGRGVSRGSAGTSLLGDLPQGLYRLRVTAIGWAPSSLDSVWMSESDTTQVTVRLVRA